MTVPYENATPDESRARKMKPKALDLFCGAGGATKGLQNAGFHVTGVDIKAQPRYCGDVFHQGDALAFPLDGFDFIWASPPCQFATSLRTMHNARRHENLIPQTRARLISIGAIYAIENVEGARRHLYDPIKLCGTMFGLGTGSADLQRHRYFETSFPILMVPQCQHGFRATIGVYGGHIRNRKRRTIGVYGEGCRSATRKTDRGVEDFTIDEGREAMGIDWMTTAELSQAIPPAYSEFIGHRAIALLSAAVALKGQL